MNEVFLHTKLAGRQEQHAYRQLRIAAAGIDFCSNDYLGIVKNDLLTLPAPQLKSGSTGSRLLTGNNELVEQTEARIAAFHNAEAGLIFNSGYDANLGILSAVPQRGDTVLYDYLSHASIRDGLRLGLAQSYSFLHNDTADLEKKLATAKGNVFVVTESVFSMDGDMAPLKEIADLCQHYHAFLIVDEAHATGVMGSQGAGLVQALELEQQCFARIHTFGKALGCHGAVVLGTVTLREYLVNFCRPFMYTTALPPASIAAIAAAYALFPLMHKERVHLQNLVSLFQSADTNFKTLRSETPVQSVIIPGNEAVKAAAAWCLQHGFDVRVILYPTVPKDSERLRIVLHAFNTATDLKRLIMVLNQRSGR
ncbi:MAG: 8-amino-7-oxononanoate synthase [Chitinophagaceae bacterium]